ncbi:hypothetical protein ZIOFF_038937 [Zingiber officinale]|uniref:MLO-like protein n=1 Tax=Zingiber officinale TaxID=94328 RepID=A0A8J5L2N9_ZINOF|nr:hypothetical protein ZIOFF_038937 [Zingiber officinale]
MAGEAGGVESRELDRTPTWAVAIVCSVIILISILLEKGLHHIGEWLSRKNKKALFEALEKVKCELMILGFISLLLTFGQTYISKICIPDSIADTMLPCSIKTTEGTTEEAGREHRRRLLQNVLINQNLKRRMLAAGTVVSCPTGKVPLISVNGIHQLHIFIFFLAVFHVASSAFTMALGRAKVGWDSNYFYFLKSTISVRKADYLTLRHGFINVSSAIDSSGSENSVLWVSAMIVLLLNIHEWEGLFWASLLPLVIILAVGMKLQAIITRMAIEIQERHAVVQGIPLYEFGLKSCFHDNFGFIIARVAIGVGGQVLCCYITLPLYALVSQMGTHMKKTIFDEQTSKALKQWHQAVKRKHEKSSHGSSTGEQSPQVSPLHRIQRSITTGHISATFTPSTRRNVMDHYDSDTEVQMSTLLENDRQEYGVEEQTDGGEFSFSKVSIQDRGKP